MSFIRKLRRDERGATAIEYGLIAAVLAVVIVTAFTTLGNGLTDVLEYIQGVLSGAGG